MTAGRTFTERDIHLFLDGEMPAEEQADFRQWLDASPEERATFDAVLAMEDDQLWRWFMGREPVPENAVGALVERIRQLPP